MTSMKIEFIIWVTLSQTKEFMETPKNIEAMMSWPAPRKLIDIRSFVGLAGYCRKLTKEDSESKLKPMYMLRKPSCELLVT